jgi:hypothetical protein
MSTWEIFAKCKGFRPLAIDSKGVVCYSRGALYRLGFDLKNSLFICKLPVKGLLGYLCIRFRIFDRIFRLAPSHGIILNDQLFISRRSEIWRLNLTTGELVFDFLVPNGRRALEFSFIKYPSGESELVFGEYFSNPKRSAVNVWVRSMETNSWKVKLSFAAGEIEHIHAVTSIGHRIFILCGDFDNAASIWVSEIGSSSIFPILRGSQSYRAAWITSFNNRIFYATDTQLESNYVCELKFNHGIWNSIKLNSISGSSIYSAQGDFCKYFSTTVECGVPSGNFLRDVFENRRGPGILSSKASIMRMSSMGVVEKLFSAEKDFLPFRLAQFGTFTFPTGDMPSEMVIAYATALSGFDDTCLVLKK